MEDEASASRSVGIRPRSRALLVRSAVAELHDVADEEATVAVEELRQTFTVAKERVRCIEAKALRKLRHPSRSKRLREFIES